ncbi:MAG: YHYH domain-containing protein [Bacteriovorax sp.]
MNRKLLYLVMMLFFTVTSMVPAYSHSGGTDSYGCHTNSQTGDYHCHNAKYSNPKNVRSPASSQAEVQSPKQYCCKVCAKGKACGDSCIASEKTCHQGVGCACDD